MSRKGVPHKFHIPVKRLYEIHKMIDDMPDSDNPMYNRNKEILRLVFIEGINPSEIAKMRIFYSNQNKPMCRRQIQQIVIKYVPDYFECRRKPVTKNTKIRIEETKIKNSFAKSDLKCAKCGEANNIELDHILPIRFGGDNSPENLQLLCYNCHKIKTAYENKIVKENAINARRKT